MPFEFRHYLLLVRLTLRERMSPKRRRVAWMVLLGLPLLAALNALCFLLDRMLFPGFRRVAVVAPVFIVGHARSGTTLTHQLMSRDPRFSWFMTWELAFPSLLQKKLVRALGECDRRWLDSRVARRIRAWEDRSFAVGRQMHPMSLTGPEEDEFLLVPSIATSYVANVFPYLRELQELRLWDAWPEAKRRRVLGFYRECIRRQLYLNGPGKTHLCKSPSIAGKLQALLEVFPDARFVLNLRHPYQTIPSLQKMMWRNWKASDVDEERIRDSLAVLREQSFDEYREPLAVFARRPELRVAELEYRRLTESPTRGIAGAYAALGLDSGPELEAALAEEEQRHAEHRPEHRYSLEEFGITRQEIRRELGALFERFGWEP